MSEEESLTYAETGVDIEASEEATAALIDAIGSVDADDFAGVLDIGDRYLALATDGVGTKLLVAEAIGDYTTIGIDCIAMNVNDLVAMGITPLGFVDYLAVDEPDERLTAEIGEGLATGASEANISLMGGETAVLPEVVTGFDLAGACVGIAQKGELLTGAAAPGDVLVGFPSSGIHSNGLTLARAAATRNHDYTDPFPPDPAISIGEALLTPTALYTDLLPAMHAVDARGAAHITGGGWTNLFRLGEFAYDIDSPHPAQPIFEFIAAEGNIAEEECYRTFNMGTGFVVCVPPTSAEEFIELTGGRRIGTVDTGASVAIAGLSLTP